MIGALTRQKLYCISYKPTTDDNTLMYPVWVFGEISCQHHIDNIELQSNKEKLYRNGKREKDNSSGGEGFPPFQSNVLLSNV